MEQLAEFKDKFRYAESTAELLKDAIVNVAQVTKYDDDGEDIFPRKDEVIEDMANAVAMLEDLANMVGNLPKDAPDQSTPTQSDESWLTFSKREAEPWLSFLQNHHYELGEIMDAMATDGEDIAEEDYIWMRRRLVLTRRTIEEILYAAKYQLHLPSNFFFNEPSEVATNGEKTDDNQ